MVFDTLPLLGIVGDVIEIRMNSEFDLTVGAAAVARMVCVEADAVVDGLAFAVFDDVDFANGSLVAIAAALADTVVTPIVVVTLSVVTLASEVCSLTAI